MLGQEVVCVLWWLSVWIHSGAFPCSSDPLSLPRAAREMSLGDHLHVLHEAYAKQKEALEMGMSRHAGITSQGVHSKDPTKELPLLLFWATNFT